MIAITPPAPSGETGSLQTPPTSTFSAPLKAPAALDNAAEPQSAGRPGERTGSFNYLVRDRAGQFTAPIGAVPADGGIHILKISLRRQRLRGKVPAHREGRTDRPHAHHRPASPDSDHDRVRRATPHPAAASRSATPPSAATPDTGEAGRCTGLEPPSRPLIDEYHQAAARSNVLSTAGTPTSIQLVHPGDEGRPGRGRRPARRP